MSNLINRLNNQYSPSNRFATFGPVILALDIKGIKGTNCKITFDFPVTAISGFNGAGKSTIAQIALCMYRAVDGDNVNERKYLKNFFMKTLLDKSPYTTDANITVTYAADREFQSTSHQLLLENTENSNCVKEMRVYYSTDRWAGYKHQPQKNVYYYGMSYFIPYQEQNSNLLKDSSANITDCTQFSETIVQVVADILSIKYTNLQNNHISNKKRTESVLSANKNVTSYSENHMGCGEGRLLKLVHALETAPNKSLFVIEEPETALHQLAQYKLAQYLLDVCNRKKHQIIFTTHSLDIQQALPIQARKYIQRENDGTTSVVNSPSIAQIQNYFSGGYVKRMIVVTEDEIGKLYIKEILRAFCPEVFKNCEFFAMNLGYEELKKYVRRSQECGIKIFGVVDENRRADIEHYVLAFPEEHPPEISIFNDEHTKEAIIGEFNFDCSTLSCDHHNYFNDIAKTKNEDVLYVKNRCIKLHIASKDSTYYQPIIEQMKNWLAECN